MHVTILFVMQAPHFPLSSSFSHFKQQKVSEKELVRVDNMIFCRILIFVWK